MWAPPWSCQDFGSTCYPPSSSPLITICSGVFTTTGWRWAWLSTMSTPAQFFSEIEVNSVFLRRGMGVNTSSVFLRNWGATSLFLFVQLSMWYWKYKSSLIVLNCTSFVFVPPYIISPSSDSPKIECVYVASAQENIHRTLWDSRICTRNMVVYRNI